MPTIATNLDRVNSAPLVGVHFHPPARALLSALRTNTPLRLQREPDNPYDPNAIGVWLDISDIDYDTAIDVDALSGYGFTPDEIVATGCWQLGHIAAKTGEAAIIAPLMDAGVMPQASLGFNMKGAPIVQLDWTPSVS